MAALAVLLVPASEAAAAKKVPAPVITHVSPMSAKVGQTLLITGKNFRRGKRRNSVGFKADGRAVVFAKSDVSTTRRIYVKLPKGLQSVMTTKAGVATATRFRLRILAGRFGAHYTATKLSPVIGPAPAAASVPGGTNPVGQTGSTGSAGGSGSTGGTTTAPVDNRGPEGDCDNDGIKNADETDDDNDLLPDTLENTIGTDGCNADSDGDGAIDGYEYQSAIDLNDDTYQNPQESLPYPGKRPYPNPLYADATVDYDGDGLDTLDEQALWKYTWNVNHTAARTLTPLSYSAGKQYSLSIVAATYDKEYDFLTWASGHGYRTVDLSNQAGWTFADGTTPLPSGTHSYGLLDVDRSGSESAAELTHLDSYPDGYLSDNERDEDADGLSNYDETRGRLQSDYWKACYSKEPPFTVTYAGTSAVDPDSDGDGVLDGADDQDHDDIPNVMEVSRWAASHLDDSIGTCDPDPTLDSSDRAHHANVYGMVNPFNPCEPNLNSRTCPKVIGFTDVPAPFTGPYWWALQ